MSPNDALQHEMKQPRNSAAPGQKPNGLTIWAIYDSPLDMPGQFVARKWINDTPTSEVLTAATLDELLSKLPTGLHRIPRAASDEPQIVETWI